MFRNWLVAVLTVLALGLSACSGVETKAEYPNRRAGDEDAVYGQREGIFGKGGIGLFGNKKTDEAAAAGVTVNAYLWRAALDTISFMPLTSADPFGGTIITDWYESPNAKGERVKANIFVLGRQLRTDMLKVTLFRQTNVKGTWKNAPVDPATVTQLENAILTRARQLKVAANE